MKILITGAAGKIGNTLRQGLRGRYALLRLTDVAPLDPAVAGEEIVRADLSDLAAVEAAMKGIDCVVHLGAVPGEDTWDKILPNNVVGTWNVFEAARRRGVRRVVYASSHHTIGFYRRARPAAAGRRLRREQGVRRGRRPPFADKHGLSVACLRIGAFQEKPADRRQLHVWLSPRDAVQLVGCCIDAPDYHFIVVYGVSDNARNRYRNVGVEFLGYRPQDKAEDHAADILRAPDTEDAISRQFHGGPYTEMGFDGDLARIE